MRNSYEGGRTWSISLEDIIIIILLCDNFPNKKKELNLRMIKLWKRNHRALFLFQFYSRIPPYSYPSLTKNVTTHCEIRTAFVKMNIYKHGRRHRQHNYVVFFSI